MTAMFATPPEFVVCAPLADEDRQFLSLMARSEVQIRRQLQDLAAGFSLEPGPGFDIIFDVYASEKSGCLRTLGGMATATGLASSTATRWVRDLEAKGLVTKHQDEKDRRRIYLRLTDEGICLAEQALCAMRIERTHLDRVNSLFPPRNSPVAMTELMQLRRLVLELPSDTIPILLRRAPFAFANMPGTPDRDTLPCAFERDLEAMIEAGAFESALLHLTRCFQIPWSPWSARIAATPTATSLETTRLLFLDMLDSAMTRTSPAAQLSASVLERV